MGQAIDCSTTQSEGYWSICESGGRAVLILLIKGLLASLTFFVVVVIKQIIRILVT